MKKIKEFFINLFQNNPFKALNTTGFKKFKLFKKESKPSRKEIYMILIPTLLIANALGIIYLVNQSSNVYKVKSDMLYYYNDNEYSLDKGLKFVRTSKGVTMINYPDNQQKATSLPVYFRNEDKLFLPENMIYYSGRNFDCYKTDYFSTIVKKDTGIFVYSETKTLKRNLPGGFLYDGDTRFVFLEEVKITYNGYEATIAPLSYLEIIDGEYVTIYNYGTGQEFSGYVTEEIKVVQKTGDFTLLIKGRTLKFIDGSAILLFSDPDLCDSVWRLD